MRPRLGRSTRPLSHLALLLFATLPAMTPGCSCDDASTKGTGGDTSAPGATTGTAGDGGGGLGGNTSSATLVGPGTGVGGSGGSTGVGGQGGGEACIYVPPAGELTPALECAWTGPGPGAPYGNRDDVVMTPVVVNLTDDDGDGVVTLNDVPDIAFVTYDLQGDGCCNRRGALRVVSGGCNLDGTMRELFTVGGNEIEADLGIADVWLDNSGGLAAGDIDGDGSVDVVGTTVNGGTIAFERTGAVKWYQPDHPSAALRDHLAGTTPSIADLDGDGAPEIILGRVVLNGEDGSLAWRGDAGTGINAFLGPVSAVSDVDLDGDLDVLAGNTLYDGPTGSVLWTYDFAVPSSAANCGAPGAYGCDGFDAVGNFDDDDEGEVVITRAGVIYVLNHDGTPLLGPGGAPVEIAIPKLDCTLNEGGPPTVADFDGDGRAEIGVAAADYYVVADLDCLADPLPADCSDPGIRWKVENADCSSRSTGSSVFDFDGDGRAEVIYNDELFFRVFDGTTGETLVEVENHSHTRLEMPIVADVDNDGNAEIVFIENASGGGGSQGIRVWGSADDSWVPTRRIWNQHAYHVTNVDELGGIPTSERVNWLEPTDATTAGVMNNFRQNLPDFDVFAAPDLTVVVSIDTGSCPSGVTLDARVCNAGALGVGAGILVTFWDNATMSAIACAEGEVRTDAPLAAGACATVSCTWVDAPDAPATLDVRACVDNDGYACTSVPGTGNNECHEDNNRSDGQGEGCSTPG